MRKIILPILLLLSNVVFGQMGFRFATGQSLRTVSKTQFPKSHIIMSPRVFYSHWGFDFGIGLDIGGLNVDGKVVSDKPTPADSFDLKNDRVSNTLFYTSPYVFVNYSHEVYKSMGVYGGVMAGFMRAGNINSDSRIYHELQGYYTQYYVIPAGVDNMRTRSLGAHAGVFYKLNKSVSFNLEGAFRKVSLPGMTVAHYHPYRVYPDAVPREIRQTFSYYPVTIGVRYLFAGSKKPKEPVQVEETQIEEGSE